MGVDDPDRLQIGIDDRGAHKLHSAFFQISGESIRERGEGSVVFINRFAIGEAPQVTLKGAVLFLDFPKDLCIVHGGTDFQSVADDIGILQ